MPPQSGCRPILVNTWPIWALSAAILRSHPRARLAPPPAATPLRDAITGCGASRMMADTPRMPSTRRRPVASSNRSISWRSSPTSAPAQKARPAPVRTMARTAEEPATMPSASFSSCTISTVKALSLSGRFSVMVPTAPSMSTAICE